MLGFLYMLIAFLTGFIICKLAFRPLDTITYTTFRGKEINLSPYLVLVPAWFTVGTILITWTTYIFAYIYSSIENPLGKANTTAMILMLMICAVGALILYKKDRLAITEPGRSSWTKAEVILLVVTVVLACVLMGITLFVSHNQLYVGLSVFSDFSPHLGMIRSFSTGNNIPTTYSHFAGSDIKYHFMFQFLVGNLEFLGMRIDLAMNIPSILGFVNTVALLYVLAVKLSGKKMVGILSCAFFAFRSSKSLFTFLANIPAGKDVVEELLLNDSFIGYTTNEDWGLWNLNVYCNQRHLAFTIPVMLLILILFIQRFYDAEKRYRLLANGDERTSQGNIDIEQEDTLTREKGSFKKAIELIRFSLLSKEGWRVKEPGTAIAAGLLLGAAAFFNGAVVIAVLSVLFLLAIVSDRRLEFLIMAVIAVMLAFIQSSVFIDGSVISPDKGLFFFGFIAENKTFWGVIDYIIRLLGIMPLLLIIAFIIVKGVRKYVLFAFSAPFIIAFTLSLTIDVTVNHKYVMLSVMLLNIFVAIFITKLYENRAIFVKTLCALLIVLMTATGVYDFYTILLKNAPKNDFIFNMDDDITEWVIENSDARDIFLTSNYALNPLVLGGAQMYLGWQYFGWSAGYDTDGRLREVIKMYSADSPWKLDALIKKHDIRYIVVDRDNRTSTDYKVNEENIAATYEKVFETGSGEWMTSIYDTTKRR